VTKVPQGWGLAASLCSLFFVRGPVVRGIAVVVASLPEIAGVASLLSSENGPLMSLLWQKPPLSNESCHSSPAYPVHLTGVRSPEIAWISRKALWREAWCAGGVCHLPVNQCFFANGQR